MNDLAKYLFLLLICVLVCFTGNVALAAPSPSDAGCTITCNVNGIMEWDTANFAVEITLGPVTGPGAYNDNDSDTIILYTNGDVDITADSGDDDALLTNGVGADTLVTEYAIGFDAESDGAVTWGTPGADGTQWQLHNVFLTPTAATVTHETEDGAITVTLHCRVSTSADEVPDLGVYTAEQTLTATWTGAADP